MKTLREEHHKAKEIAEKLIQQFGTEPLSYSEVCYWMREFAQAANRQKMPGDQDGP
jgi:hypothetical protein